MGTDSTPINPETRNFRRTAPSFWRLQPSGPPPAWPPRRSALHFQGRVQAARHLLWGSIRFPGCLVLANRNDERSLARLGDAHRVILRMILQLRP